MAKKKTRVTVVIPTYNRAKFLSRTIRSIKRQSMKNWKLLIMDDGSTDKTRKVVARFLKDRRIRYVRQKKNKGVSYTLNHALKLVRTKYFAQLDSDDWYDRKTLQRCVNSMERSSPKVAVVYGHEKVWRVRGNGKIKRVKWKRKKKIKSKYDLVTFRKMISPRFYRTKALRKVGGWSTKVPYGGRYAEDRQILLKLAGKYKFKRINKTLYNRLEHKKNNSRQENRMKYAKVTRYLYKKTLKKWGNKYRPVFKWIHGRLKVHKLKRVKK